MEFLKAFSSLFLKSAVEILIFRGTVLKLSFFRPLESHPYLIISQYLTVLYSIRYNKKIRFKLNLQRFYETRNHFEHAQ